MPEHAPQLQAWCARLGMENYGGGLASTSLAVLQELLRKKRRSIGEEEKAVILEQSEGVCHLCGGCLDEHWECSHVLKLSRQSAEQVRTDPQSRGIKNGSARLPSELHEIPRLWMVSV